MSKYDLVFLLNEESELKNIKDSIESTTGKVISEKSWGKKTLAYPIKKQGNAFFYDWEIEIDPTKTGDLKKKFNFNEKLLRYLLIKSD
jgi:small subunit ribosomal protein S6